MPEQEPREDDALSIPLEWEDARTYLERSLEERRRMLEARDDAIERKIEMLSVRIEDTQTELHGIRDGVQHLNESFRHVSEQNALLINMIGTDAVEQKDRWKSYEDEQKKQGELIEKGVALLVREDKTRYPMRLGTLVFLFVILFVLVAEKVV